MTEQFLHGVEIIEIDDGARPIQTVKSSVIGLVGTASKGPVNTPTLILGSPAEAVTIFGSDANFSIPSALDAIFNSNLPGIEYFMTVIPDPAEQGLMHLFLWNMR